MKDVKFVKIDVLLFSITLLVLLFWLIVGYVDVYEFKILGIIAEILWLPMIILPFALPIFSLFALFLKKIQLTKFLIFSLILQVTILMIQFTK